MIWIDDLQPLGVKPKRPHPIGPVERLWARWLGDPKGRLEEERNWLQIPDGWLGAQGADAVSFDDVVHVLANSVGMRSERLLWLRRRIWWSLNNRYRNGSVEVRVLNAPHWSEVEELANMEALLDLLNARAMTAAEQVQKGEILRLLGRFEEAVAVLKAVPPDGHNEIRAVKIERLAQQRDQQVRALGEELH
ncbi:hypothetical protein [Pseudoduganella sp. R-34]|uniref:hypothetical protein n=1 Tax=Pseudoduganella sp. R-34 TaxID=3404062 RepID=UPI003CF3AB12